LKPGLYLPPLDILPNPDLNDEEYEKAEQKYREWELQHRGICPICMKAIYNYQDKVELLDKKEKPLNIAYHNDCYWNMVKEHRKNQWIERTNDTSLRAYQSP
jgi:hypothetical protein